MWFVVGSLGCVGWWCWCGWYFCVLVFCVGDGCRFWWCLCWYCYLVKRFVGIICFWGLYGFGVWLVFLVLCVCVGLVLVVCCDRWRCVILYWSIVYCRLWLLFFGFVSGVVGFLCVFLVFLVWRVWLDSYWFLGWGCWCGLLGCCVWLGLVLVCGCCVYVCVWGFLVYLCVVGLGWGLLVYSFVWVVGCWCWYCCVCILLLGGCCVGFWIVSGKVWYGFWLVGCVCGGFFIFVFICMLWYGLFLVWMLIDGLLFLKCFYLVIVEIV